VQSARLIVVSREKRCAALPTAANKFMRVRELLRGAGDVPGLTPALPTAQRHVSPRRWRFRWFAFNRTGAGWTGQRRPGPIARNQMQCLSRVVLSGPWFAHTDSFDSKYDLPAMGLAALRNRSFFIDARQHGEVTF
jgi:hypothetical protein